VSKVVAITRNGIGGMWLFDSMKEADEHPIVQYGDVICSGPDSILRQYTRLEIPYLLTRLGDPSFRMETLMSAASPTGWDETMSRRLPRMWEMMLEQAKRPPSDPADVFSIIVRDRRLSITESRTRGETTMSKTNEAKDTKAKDTKDTKVKETKAEQPKSVGGYPLNGKITLLCDKDGKPYGKDNNPKRPGSATHARFESYANGQTVEQAYKAGVAAGDFAYDVNKQFIKIDVPEDAGENAAPTQESSQASNQASTETTNA
jgi:hypothetical protein